MQCNAMHCSSFDVMLDVLMCRWCPDDLLLDPYAPLISGRRKFGVRDEIEQFEQKVRYDATCLVCYHCTCNCNTHTS